MLPSDGAPSTAEDLGVWRELDAPAAATATDTTAPSRPVAPPMPFPRMSLRGLRMWKQLSYGEIAAAMHCGATAEMVETAEKGGATVAMRALVRATVMRMEGLPLAEPTNGPEAIARVRLCLGLSQAAFGAALGTNSAAVYRWEHGEMVPPPAMLAALTRLAAVDLAPWFAARAPKPATPYRHLRVVRAPAVEAEPSEESDDDDTDDDEGDEGEAAEEKAEATPHREGSKRRHTRARTLSIKRLSKREIERGRMLYPESEVYARPRTRGDCLHGEHAERPCPFVSCKHHLYLDVNEKTGSIKTNFPDLEVWELPHTCTLDIADRGGLTLEEVGEVMNLTRERIRQLETRAMAKLKALSAMDGLSDFLDDSGGRSETEVSTPRYHERIGTNWTPSFG